MHIEADQENQFDFRIRTTSRVSPIEAGYGLLHADTIVATTEDELTVAPSTAQLKLTAGGKTTLCKTADLNLAPGSYDALLEIREDDALKVSKEVKLLLVDPSRVCRRFGARHGSLEYTLPVITGKDSTTTWEALWKTGEFADIVVDFEEPYKFVLWRGMSYAPSWAMDNVMTSLFFAETLEPGVYRDCCEMMSDRECRYSHARVIHSSEARVVIHWRCALADPTYSICRDIWVDEIHTIYPDGVGVRNVTVHLDPNDPDVWQTLPGTGERVPCSMINTPTGKRSFNDMEFVTVNAPGATSDDNLPLDAFTLMDTKDFSEAYKWPKPPDFRHSVMPKLREYIFRINYRGRPGTFIASPGKGLQVSLEDNTQGMRYVAGALVKDDYWERISELPSNFIDCIHWPVTRGYGTTSLTDRDTYQERPTHTFLGYANNSPVEVRDIGAVTWSWLSGIAPEDDEDLRLRVRAWTDPTHIEGAKYVAGEGAYLIDDPGDEVTLTVSRERIAVCPTFILDGWDGQGIQVLVNGVPVEKDAIAVGIERSLDKVLAVVTVRQNLAQGSSIHISMQ